MYRFLAFALISVWSASVWYGRLTAVPAAPGEEKKIAVFVDEDLFPESHALTDEFWAWEAERRLTMIDMLLDDERLIEARNNWREVSDIHDLAAYVVALQQKAYGVDTMFDPPEIMSIPMRGDANGLYIPREKTLYINSKMRWNNLPFERFMEVVLHENMHHIITQTGPKLDTADPLKSDFMALATAAYFHDEIGMAQDRRDIPQVNPQELVAWQTQRAARYAGIIGADDLTVWDMTTRTQEIRVLQEEAGF